MIFQLDGAPPHWGLQFCAFLNDKFLERWIGKGGSAAWPPRSPYINHLDFFLWGYVNIEVFKSLQLLKDLITQAFAQITILMIEKPVETFKNAHDNRGSHVEVNC